MISTPGTPPEFHRGLFFIIFWCVYKMERPLRPPGDAPPAHPCAPGSSGAAHCADNLHFLLLFPALLADEECLQCACAAFLPAGGCRAPRSPLRRPPGRTAPTICHFILRMNQNARFGAKPTFARSAVPSTRANVPKRAFCPIRN